MSKEELQRVAVEHGGYATPSLNDTLYLHFKGYRSIENLDEYVNLTSLWLHSNGFARIEGLDNLPKLRCLFLQQNAFTRIEGLACLSSLVQLDLSDNSIRLVEGLSHLPNLATLNLSKNVLADASGISHLKECGKLSALDLSKNELGGEDVVACLAGIVTLTSLNLDGNPIARKLAHFRKKMIISCKNLRYLDRPVFPEERAAAEAWDRGGSQAEQDAKASLLQSKRDAAASATQEFRAWQQSVRGAPRASAPTHEVAADGEECDHMVESPRSGDDDETETPPDIEFSVESRRDEQPPQGGENAGAPCRESTNALAHGNADQTVGLEALSEEEEKCEDAAAVSDVEEDVPSEDSPPSFEEAEQVHCATTTTLEQRARVIRDSLSVMRCRKQNFSNVQMGWTDRSERTLKKLAVDHDYDWSKVALQMKHEFGADFGDEDALERRHALLSLSAEIVNEVEAEDGESGAFQFPPTATTKPLSAFLTEEGVRKSFAEILQGGGDGMLDGSEEENRPPSLPTSNATNEEDDVAVVQAENLWQHSLTSLHSPGAS